MSKYVPANVTERVKQGFSAPDASWFKGESIDYVRRVIHNDGARIYDYLDRTAVRRLVNHHLEGKENRRLSSGRSSAWSSSARPSFERRLVPPRVPRLRRGPRTGLVRHGRRRPVSRRPAVLHAMWNLVPGHGRRAAAPHAGAVADGRRGLSGALGQPPEAWSSPRHRRRSRRPTARLRCSGASATSGLDNRGGGMEGESAGVIDEWFLGRFGWNGLASTTGSWPSVAACSTRAAASAARPCAWPSPTRRRRCSASSCLTEWTRPSETPAAAV
jgi:hypothetical protein